VRGYCGDGVRNGNELCDGHDHEDNSCASLGAIAGALGCNAYCQPTTDACTWGSFRLMARVRSMEFTAVWASSPRDMWASSEAEHLLHFDGERWTPVAVDRQAPISRFWGSNDGQVWAWSVDGRLAVHDGRGWTVAHRDLGDASVAASSPSNVWAANSRERTLRHFDGSRWSELAMPAFVEAVFTLEDDTAWISGVYLEHYDGVEWTSHDLGGGLTHCILGTSDRDATLLRTASTESPSCSTTMVRPGPFRRCHSASISCGAGTATASTGCGSTALWARRVSSC
jgi:hypothetical protein